MFSARLPAVLAPNAVTRSIARLRERNVPLLDLTETNPTAVGIPYPDDVLAPLADVRGRCYAPAPLGLEEARRVIAAEYQRDQLEVNARQVVLTASTSEAYTLLFKLLCNAGDEVLTPVPSYPLFDLLTRFENVAAVPYKLEYHQLWSIDRESVERALTSSTRAILVVSPNNPTGSMLRASDLEWLDGLCASRSMALIADEVFADYPLAVQPDARRVTGNRSALTFSLGGLSKSAGLPQVKLGWIVLSGPDSLVNEALIRIEILCDTYLSVSTPVQLAAGHLIAAGRDIRRAISSRISDNLARLRTLINSHPSISLLDPEGGWSAVLRVPARVSEEEIVLGLLDREQVIVHPGYFFDFPDEAYLIASLLPDPSIFEEGIVRVLRTVEGDAQA